MIFANTDFLYWNFQLLLKVRIHAFRVSEVASFLAVQIAGLL